MVSLWGDGRCFRGGRNAPPKAAMGNGSGIIRCISESRCFCSCHCLYFCGERGKNGMKGKIKKYAALVLSVQQLLCGCSATELEDRCFPMMAWLWTKRMDRFLLVMDFKRARRIIRIWKRRAREYRACHGKDNGKLCADL